MDYEKILFADNKLEENFEVDKTQEKLEETYRLDYGYVLNENERFTERRRLSEISSSTFSGIIKDALKRGETAKQAGIGYGAKYAQHAYDNTIEARSMIKEGININHFYKDKPDINTKLVENVYKDICIDLKKEQPAKEFFESFVAEVKKVGVPFAPSATLNIA